MQTRHRIVLAAAGLLAGVQIGTASIGISTVDPSEQMEPTPSEVSASADGTSGQSTEAQSEPTAALVEARQDTTAVAEAPTQSAIPHRAEPWRSPFPASADDLQMLPAMAEYLARTEHLRVTGASGTFPASGDELQMLPAMVAYHEQREANRRLAQAQQQVAGDALAANMTAASQPQFEAPGPLERAREQN